MAKLLFGIPELDRLLDLKRGHFYAPREDDNKLTSIALLGPDGTGKSVLALHLVSRYFADSYKPEDAPTILYISTDLRFEKAERIWQNFALNIPYERDIPCERASDKWERASKKQKCARQIESFKLELLKPTGRQMADFLVSSERKGVGFLDLAASSAGDDWGYVIRTLSLLNNKLQGHLVIIDSVAGFEMLTGETDAYGERTARRARIAHVMRMAQERCHIVFVVEESQEGRHLPEEFVSDTVIRLRRRIIGGSMRRTVEIEKARGRAHASGEHPYGILDGMGSSTGVWENPDEPRASSPNKEASSDPKSDTQTNTYVQIYYSLQYRNQRIKARRGFGKPDGVKKLASFGIKHLDEMLAQNHTGKGLWCGKTCSLIGDPGTGKTALSYSFLCEGVSDYAKRLVLLTKAFAADTFDVDAVREVGSRLENWLVDEQPGGAVKARPLAYESVQSKADFVEMIKAFDREVLRDRVEMLVLEPGKTNGALDEQSSVRTPQTWAKDWRLNDTTYPDPPLRRVQYPWAWYEHCPDKSLEIADWLLRHPACASPGVLITTGDVKADDLAKRFVQWLGPQINPATAVGEPSHIEYANKLFNYAAQHLICRRLESQDATGPLLFHIIEWSLLEAQRLLFGPILPNIVSNRSGQSWRIRLVIDNLRILRNMYPTVREDPLFLPLLVFYLGRENVTSLIVDTDSGRPDTNPSDEISRELRSLVSHQLYTWEVPFFGQRRIAIASVPPLSKDFKGVIREVRLATELGQENNRPVVDPHFELYSGLEEGKPETVPLEVRLFAETPAFQEYVRQENLFFKQVFPSTGALGLDSDIIVGLGAGDLEAMRGFVHMPTDIQLDHTLVFQVDGSWALKRQGSMRSQYRYLTESTTDDSSGSPFLTEDPFRLFQPTNGGVPQGRSDYFKNKYYRRRVWLTEKRDEAFEAERKKVDRVPFMWDFGFLLCKNDPWELALNKPLTVTAENLAGRCVSEGEALEQTRAGALDEFLAKHAPTEQFPSETAKQLAALKIILKQQLTVASVWNALPKTKDRELLKDQPPQEADTKFSLNELAADGLRYTGKLLLTEAPRLDSWRAFLEAAHVVADTAADRLGHPIQPFDFAAMTGDSVSCMVFEIWFSEIWRRKSEEDNAITLDVSRAEYVEPRNGGIIKLLTGDGGSLFESYKEFVDDWQAAPKGERPAFSKYARGGYSIELYMTWLLLLEVLDFSSFEHPADPFDFRPDRTPVQEAIAARHWYKTACVAASNGEKTGHPSELTVAVRLPGHYSARGDWFLATAKGSRSERLAERALDVLSSRRANILRLQAGLGLPTRDIVSDQHIGETRTSLRGPNSIGIIDNVKYGHLYEMLGASHASVQAGVDEPQPRSRDFHWFHRSGLEDYDRQSRPWRKWLSRLFLWTHQYHRQRRSRWVGGFKPYDQLQRGDFSTVINFPSFLDFAKMCDLLVAELNAAR